MKKIIRRNVYYILILFITFVTSFLISFFSFSGSRNLSLAASNHQNSTIEDKAITITSNNNVQAVSDSKTIDTSGIKSNPESESFQLDVKKEIEKVSSKDDEKPIEENKSNGDKIKEEKPRVDNTSNTKIAYLTFDDGPSSNITPKILDVLKNYKVKATFFVIGSMVEQNPGLLQRAKNEGHAIANHTYSHDFNYIYSDPQNFLNDILKGEEVLKKHISDFSSKNIRFPGGSFGDKRKPFKELMQSLGYNIIDWNSLNGDSEALNIPPDKLLNRLKETYNNQKNLIVLMHDAPSKDTTVQALPQIIQFLQSQGYTFKTFD